jgi:hypothetical protein
VPRAGDEMEVILGRPENNPDQHRTSLSPRKHVDDGDGWLIFALPPAELGIHPAEGPTFDSGVRHQLTLMCDDITATIQELSSKGIEVRGEPQDEGFGITTTIALPGGLELMLYEPRHQTAI